MPSIDHLMYELDETTVAQKIGIPHDEARMRYSLRSNTVGSFDEFSHAIGDYYNYHFTSCVSPGGRLSSLEAIGRAKEILAREYQRRGGDIVSAYNDAHDGTNGGMRAILDLIAENLKTVSIEHYIRSCFDRHVTPNSWTQKVEIIRQFMSRCGTYLSASVRANPAERYAHSYEELIRSYVQGLKQTSSILRRL